MLTFANTALGQTLALLATFIGIGIFVTVLMIYIFAQLYGEHKENREADQGGV